MGTLNNMTSLANRPRFIDLKNSSIEELTIGSTSKGNQPKYYNYSTHEYIKEQFCYQGVHWKDYMVEVLSSIIAKQLHTNVEIIQQETVRLSNGKMGCISTDFSKDSYEWIPLSRTKCYDECRRERGKSFKVFSTIKNYFDTMGLDIVEYLTVMIVMDFLLGNEDRHYGNFGFLRNRYGDISVAPLFDFGLGLFAHDTTYSNVPLLIAIQLMDGKPFDENLQKPVDMLFNIGYGSLIYNIFKDISIPDKKLFPSDLGYQYFVKSFTYLKERMSEYEIC